MAVPDYVTLIILTTGIFLSASLAVMFTHGFAGAGLEQKDKQKAVLRVALVFAAWIAAALALSYTELLIPKADAFPLLGVVIVAITLSALLTTMLSSSLGLVIAALPLHWLAAVQIYRVIGLVFLLLHADGLLSGYFALSTGWGDIAVGVTAPLVAWLLYVDAARYRLLALAWCAAGIADLVLVLFKAVRSSPGPLQATSFELPTEIIGYFPFPLIPLTVVPISIILHVVLIQRLLRRPKTASSVAAA